MFLPFTPAINLTNLSLSRDGLAKKVNTPPAITVDININLTITSFMEFDVWKISDTINNKDFFRKSVRKSNAVFSSVNLMINH